MTETSVQKKLTIELVPSTCWFSNVRSNVSASDWEICKRFVRRRSRDRCEICGGRGQKWPVECHEIWEYDDEACIQRLSGLIALCPACHQVKHIGRTMAVGGQQALARSIEHLCRVNHWNAMQAEQYIDIVFHVHEIRSTFQWTLDISYLERLGINVQPVLDRKGS